MPFYSFNPLCVRATKNKRKEQLANPRDEYLDFTKLSKFDCKEWYAYGAESLDLGINYTFSDFSGYSMDAEILAIGPEASL